MGSAHLQQYELSWTTNSRECRSHKQITLLVTDGLTYEELHLVRCEPNDRHLPTDNAVQIQIQGRGAIRCSKRTATAALCLPTFLSFRCRSRFMSPTA